MLAHFKHVKKKKHLLAKIHSSKCITDVISTVEVHLEISLVLFLENINQIIVSVIFVQDSALAFLLVNILAIFAI